MLSLCTRRNSKCNRKNANKDNAKFASFRHSATGKRSASGELAHLGLCTASTKCINCKANDHITGNPKCKEFIFQHELNTIMKVENISYKVVPQRLRSTPRQFKSDAILYFQALTHNQSEMPGNKNKMKTETIA